MIKDIKTGISTFILLENGDLFGCGANPYNKLGIDNAEREVLSLQMICSDVEKVYPFYRFTLVLKKDKSLWYSGIGTFLNEKSNITSFSRKIEDDVEDILASDTSPIFCLKSDGKLIDLLDKELFLTDVNKIKCIDKDSYSYFFAIKNDNSLWMFEENNFVKVLDNVKDVFSDYMASFYIQDINDSLWKVRKYDFKDGKKLLDNIKQIEVSAYNCCLFLTKDGILFAFGHNYLGRLGSKERNLSVPVIVNKNVEKIYLNNRFSILLKKDNTLWGCGENIYKILDDRSIDCRFYYPWQIMNDVKDFYIKGGNSLCAIKQNDELWGSGEISRFFKGPNNMKLVSEDVKNVFSNGLRFFVLRKDNSLLCFGDNEHGQLGLGLNCKNIEKPIENNYFKNIYTFEQVAEVIKSTFKEKTL